jgi:DNA-binding NarL/FixJ family response regulator
MIRILVVDDHEMVRRGLASMLVECFPECEFGEAQSEQRALEQLSGQRWDLVLLDINLPGRSGLEVLQEVKERWPRLPVLIVSSYPEQAVAVRCIRGGAAGYLTKDSAADELAAAVKKTLAGGRYITATLAERIAKVLGGDGQQDPHELLSSRELQVVRMVANGRTQKEIAAELHLSEKTIATYRARIAEKLGLSTGVELAKYALQHDLVD